MHPSPMTGVLRSRRGWARLTPRDDHGRTLGGDGQPHAQERTQENPTPADTLTLNVELPEPWDNKSPLCETPHLQSSGTTNRYPSVSETSETRLQRPRSPICTLTCGAGRSCRLVKDSTPFVPSSTLTLECVSGPARVCSSTCAFTWSTCVCTAPYTQSSWGQARRLPALCLPQGVT